MQSNKLEQSPRTNVKRYKKQHVEAICVGLQYGHKTCLPLINRTVTVTEKMRTPLVSSTVMSNFINLAVPKYHYG